MLTSNASTPSQVIPSLLDYQKYGSSDNPGPDLQILQREDVEMFMTCTMMDQKPEPLLLETLPPKLLKSALEFSFTLLYRRFQALKIDMPCSKGLALWLVYLSEGHPGKLVMWAYTITRISQKHGGVLVSLGFPGKFLEHFGDGMPTESFYRRTWEAQKMNGGANYLDDVNNWKP